MRRSKSDLIGLKASHSIDVALTSVEAHSKTGLGFGHLGLGLELGHWLGEPRTGWLWEHTLEDLVRDAPLRGASKDEHSLSLVLLPYQLGVDDLGLLAKVNHSNHGWLQIVPHIPSTNLGLVSFLLGHLGEKVIRFCHLLLFLLLLLHLDVFLRLIYGTVAS